MLARLLAIACVGLLLLGGFVGPSPGPGGSGNSKIPSWVRGPGPNPFAGLDSFLYLEFFDDLDQGISAGSGSFVECGNIATTAAYANTGFTCTDQGTPATDVIYNDIGTSMMRVDGGTTADTGVQLVYGGPTGGLLHGAPVTIGTTPYAFARMGLPNVGYYLLLASIGYLETRDAAWAAQFTVTDFNGASAAWDSSFFFGFSLADTDIMVNSTGALTNWVTNGGIGIHISEAAVLTLNIKSGTTLSTSPGYSLAANFADGGGYFAVAVRHDFSATPGEGITYFYVKESPEAVEDVVFLEDQPWQLVGTITNGLPTTGITLTSHKPTWEVQSGTNHDLTTFTNWVAAAYPKE